MKESPRDLMRRNSIQRIKDSGGVIYQTEGIILAKQFTYVLKDFRGVYALLDLIRKSGFSASLTIDPDEIPETIDISKNGRVSTMHRNEWFVSTGHVTTRCYGEILTDSAFKERYIMA